MRDDYMAALQPYTQQVPTHLQHRFRIDFLNREVQALEAVTNPIAANGRRFAPDVAENMLRDLATIKSQSGDVIDDLVEPLQIQVVCTDLWERIKDTDPAQPIVAANIGSVSDALSAYYERGVVRADIGLERQIRTFFDDALIKDGIRNLVRLEPEVTQGLANEEIEKLVDVYLVRKESRAGAFWLELSHDRLLRPVHASNERWFADNKNLQKFQRFAIQWRREDRPESLLLLGKDLEDAHAWAQSHPELLSKPEPDEGFPEGLDRAFLAASDAKQRGIDREAQQAAKLKWRLRMAVLAATFAGVFALAAFGFAAYSGSLLRRTQESEEAAQVAAHNTSIALARSSVQEGTKLAEAGQDREALAHFARALRADPQSLDAISWISSFALNRDSWIVSFLDHPDLALPAAMSPDGRRVVTQCCNKPVLQIWDTRTRTKVGDAMDPGGALNLVWFSENNQRIVSATEEGIVRVWDAATGKPIGPIYKESESGGVNSPQVTSVRLSADGTLLAAGTSHGIVRVWDVNSGQPVGPAIRHGAAPISSVAFNHQNPRRVLSGSQDGTVRVHDLSTGRDTGLVIQTGQKTRANIAATYNADDTLIRVYVSNRTLVWSAATGRLVLGRLKASDIDSLSFSPNGRRALGSFETHAQLFDVNSASPLGAQLPALDAAVFSEDGSRLITRPVYDDANAEVWSTDSGGPVGGPLSHGVFMVLSLLSRDAREIMTGSWENTVRLWESHPPVPPVTLKPAEGTVNGLFSPDGTRVITEKAGAAQSWDVRTGMLLNSCQPGGDPALTTWVFTASGLHAVAVNADRTSAQTWVFEGCKPFGRAVPGASIERAILSADGRHLAVSTLNDTQLWTADDGAKVGSPLAGGSGINFSVDGARLLTGIGTRAVHVFEVATQKEIGEPIGYSDNVSGGEAAEIATAVFNQDGSKVVIAARDIAQARNLSTGKISPQVRHKRGTEGAQFTRDGRRFMTIAERTVQIWDSDSGNPIGAPMVHEAPVTGAAFSPDSKRIVTGNTDGVTQVWSVDSGTPIGVPLRDLDAVLSVAFSPDGRSVLTVTRHSTARIWPVLIECCKTDEEAARLATLADALSGNEVSDTGPLRGIDGFTRWQDAATSLPANPSGDQELSLNWLVRRFAPLP
jgi:WD40 repeat protein